MFNGVAESTFVEYRSAVNRRPSRLMQGWNCEREIKFWLSRQQSLKVSMGGREGGRSPRLMYFRSATHTCFDSTFRDWNHKPERTWSEEPISSSAQSAFGYIEQRMLNNNHLAPQCNVHDFYSSHKIVSIMVETLRSGNRYYLNGEGRRIMVFRAREMKTAMFVQKL